MTFVTIWVGTATYSLAFPFVTVRTVRGRETEAAWLSGRLADDVPCLVVGEPGIGKTALMRSVAEASDRPVYEGGGLAALSWMPLLAFRRALGEPPSADDPVGVASWVGARVGGGVLLLDDLQWFDEASMATLPLLAGRVGLLAGLRSDADRTSSVLAAATEAGFETLPIGPLPTDAVLQILATAAPDLSSADRISVARAAGGNPFHLLELAATGTPPAGLRRAIEARLRRLSPEGRHAARLLALLGRPSPIELLGPGGPEIVRAGVAVERDRIVSMRQSLFEEAVLTELDADEQRRLHRHLADAVGDPGESAHHLAAAGDRREAYQLAIRAANGSSSPGQVASHLALAAACAEGQAAGELRLRAASALLDSRNPTAALEVIATSRDDHRDPTIAALAHIYEARAKWYLGDNEGYRTALSSAAELTGGQGTPAEHELRIEQAHQAAIVDGDGPRGLVHARAALSLAHRLGIDDHRALRVLGESATASGDPDGLVHLEAALAGARRANDHETECNVADMLMTAHPWFRGPEGALRLGTEMAGRAADLGLVAWERHFRALRLSVLTHLAQPATVIDEALELLAEVLDARSRALARRALAIAYIQTGRYPDARREIDELAAEATDDQTARGWALFLGAEAELWAGRPQVALELTNECVEVLVGEYPLLSMCRLTRAWAAFEAGVDPGPAVEEAVFPALAAIPIETDALIRLHRDDDPRALAVQFRDAAAAWSPFALDLELRARWMQGEMLRRASDTSRARDVLLDVERGVEDTGLQALLARVQRSLRLTGIRRSAARPPADGLSDRQREIVALAGAGLSNAAIASQLGLSRSTVASHIAQAAERLGAVTRQHAAALLHSARRRQPERPLVVVEGGPDAFDRAVIDLEERGWDVRGGWMLPNHMHPAPDRLVLAGRVPDEGAVAQAVLAAVLGAGVLAWATGEHDILDGLCDDLRRFGPIEHRPAVDPAPAVDLTSEDWQLLGPLCEGISLVETARLLHIGRRTADRRMASIRRRLGVATTAEALVVAMSARSV